jgi:hypothetical protein
MTTFGRLRRARSPSDQRAAYRGRAPHRVLPRPPAHALGGWALPRSQQWECGPHRRNCTGLSGRLHFECGSSVVSSERIRVRLQSDPRRVDGQPRGASSSRAAFNGTFVADHPTMASNASGTASSLVVRIIVIISMARDRMMISIDDEGCRRSLHDARG